MESHKLVVKFFADAGASVGLDAIVPAFHHWIQDQGIPGHMLIDVADYAHVPDGPGTVLVTHEANIHFDRGEGRQGLLYVRKQPVGENASFRETLAAVFHAALFCAAKLERDPSLDGIRFRTDEIVFRINDRLLGPNEPATFARIKPDLQKFATEMLGETAQLDYEPNGERLFEVRIKSAGNASLTDLLGRAEALAATPAPAR
jgi:hypothetical protein